MRSFNTDRKESSASVTAYIEFLMNTGRYIRVWEASAKQDLQGVDVLALTKKEVGNFKIERHQVKANRNFEKYGNKVILEEYSQVFVDMRTSVNGFPMEMVGKERKKGMIFEEELSCDYIAFYDKNLNEFLILDWCEELVDVIVGWYELGMLKMNKNQVTKGKFGDSWYSTWFFLDLNYISEKYVVNW